MTRRACGLVTFLAILMHGVLDAEAGAFGAVGLDSLTFDKVIDGSRPVLVKFDKMFPHGQEEKEFAELCERVGALTSRKSRKLLVAEVQVQSHGDKRNDDLRDAMGLQEPDLPAYFLYKEGFKPLRYDMAGEAIRFEGNVTAKRLSAFLRKHTRVRVRGKGTVEEMEELIDRFLAAPAGSADRAKVVQEAHKTTQRKNGPELLRVSVYVMLMEKVMEKGDAWAAKELKRLQRMRGKPMSEAKETELESRLRVLSSLVREEL